MLRALKFTIRLLVVFIVAATVFVASVLFVALNVDPNDYKEKIVVAVKKMTGYAINIDGEIEWDIFPTLSINATRISIANPEPFEGELAFVERASAQLELLPLLREQIEIGKVMLLKPRVALLVAPDGRNNWRGKDEEVSVGDVSLDAVSGNLMTLLSGLSIAGASVVDASVVLRDEYAMEHVQTDRLSLQIGAFVPGSPSAFKLQGSMRDYSREFSASIDVATAVTIDPLLQSVSLENINATVDFQRGTDPVVNIKLAGDAAFDLEKDQISLKQIGLGIDDARFDIEASAVGLLALPRAMDLQFSSNTFNLRHLANTLNVTLPHIRNDQAFQKLAVSGDFTAKLDEQQISTTILQSVLTLDNSDSLRVQGDIVWLPELRMTLTGEMDHLDVAEYLPLSDEAEASVAPVILPLDNLRAEVEVRSATIDISRLEATVFGGKLGGVASIDMGRGETPTRWETHGEANGVDINQISKAFALKEMQSLKGAGNLLWQLSANGDDAQALTQSLGGKVELSLANSRLSNRGLAGKIEHVVAFLENRPRKAFGDEVIVERANANFDLERGVAKNHDLLVDMPLLRLSGAGVADLVASNLDYQLRVGLCSSEECKLGDEQARLSLGIKLAGTFDDIEYSLDRESLVRGVAQTVLEGEEKLNKKRKELLKEKERAVDTIKDKVNSILKGVELPF